MYMHEPRDSEQWWRDMDEDMDEDLAAFMESIELSMWEWLELDEEMEDDDAVC